MILDGMRYYASNFGISYKAISAVANLSTSSFVRDPLVNSELVPLIVGALIKFIDFADYAAEATRALVCLAVDSQEARKEAMANPEMIRIIDQASTNHDDATVQEMCCALISSLAVCRATSEMMIGHGVANILLRAMDLCVGKRVQNAACTAFRNISCQIQDSDELVRFRGTEERSIVAAMESHPKSVSI
jgi:hypothetical protein